MGVGVSLAPGTSSRAPGHLLLPPVAGLHPAGDQTSVPTWRAVCCWLVDIQKLPLVCTHPGKLLTGLSILTVMPRRGPMWRLPPLWAVSLFWRREERPPCLPLRGEGGHQWPCGLCEVPGLDCLTCLGFPCLVLILMLEAQPLCTRAKRNLMLAPMPKSRHFLQFRGVISRQEGPCVLPPVPLICAHRAHRGSPAWGWEAWTLPTLLWLQAESFPRVVPPCHQNSEPCQSNT